MVILVGNAPDLDWLTNWGPPMFLSRLGLLRFSNTIERLVISLESFPGMGL